jgi:hypothetical protein
MNSWIASLPFVSSPKKGDSDRWVTTKEPVVIKGCPGHDSETSIVWSEAPGNGSTASGCNSPCSKFPRTLPGFQGLVSISLQDEDFCVSPTPLQVSPTRGRRLGPSYFLSKSLSVRNILSPRREKMEECDKAGDSGLLLPFRDAPVTKPTTRSISQSEEQMEHAPNKALCGNSSRKEIEFDFRDLIDARDETTLDTCENSAPAVQGASLRSRLHRSISEFFSSRSEMQCEIDLDDIFEAKNRGSLEPPPKPSRECSNADSKLSMLHRSMSEIFSSRLSGSRAPVAKAKSKREAEPRVSTPPNALAKPPTSSQTESPRRKNPGSKNSELHRSMSEVFSSRSNGRCDPKTRAKSDGSTAKPKNHKDPKQRTSRGALGKSRTPSPSERQRAQRRHSMPTCNAETGLKDLLDAYDMIMSMHEATTDSEATASVQRNESPERCSTTLDSPDPEYDPAPVETLNPKKDTPALHDDTTATDEDDDDEDDEDDDDDDDRNVSYLRPASGNGPAPHEKWSRGEPSSRRLERGLSLLDEKDEEPTPAHAKALQSHASLFESTGW